jgi:hypothetical protein
LKIIEERKKDIAITFAQGILEVRKKIDDIHSTSKIENTLNIIKQTFEKDEFIQSLCSQAYNQITMS